MLEVWEVKSLAQITPLEASGLTSGWPLHLYLLPALWYLIFCLCFSISAFTAELRLGALLWAALQSSELALGQGGSCQGVPRPLSSVVDDSQLQPHGIFFVLWEQGQKISLSHLAFKWPAVWKWSQSRLMGNPIPLCSPSEFPGLRSSWWAAVTYPMHNNDHYGAESFRDKILGLRFDLR